MVDSIKLSNGYQMPLVGLGTWQAAKEEELELALDTALEAGYRHIDTAYLYCNESLIGKILKKWIDSGKIRREELFIVTKLPQIGMTPEKAPYFVKKSLESLQLTYIDLYLMHSPLGIIYQDDTSLFPMKDGEIMLDTSTNLEAIWRALENEVDGGRVRSLGVSNFTEKQLERIVKTARHKLTNHQIELHAYFQQKRLRDTCQKHGITICAYAPIGSPGRKELYKSRGVAFESNGLLDDRTVDKISRAHGKTPTQILLRYWTQQGIAVIPKSTNPDRIFQNFLISDFTLSSDEIKSLEGLDQGERGRTFSFRSLPGCDKHPEFPF